MGRDRPGRAPRAERVTRRAESPQARHLEDRRALRKADPALDSRAPHPQAIVVSIAPDGLSAELSLDVRGAEPGIAPTPYAIGRALRKAGLRFGLRASAVRAAIDALAVEGHSHAVVALGAPPQHGVDAHLSLEMEIEKQVGEDVGERIDFRERGGVLNVSRGQHIGTWHLATEGTAGRTVRGEPLEARNGEPGQPRCGRDVKQVEVGEGHIHLHAQSDGALLLAADGTLSVVDLIESEGDVDYRMGNIDVSGSVFVRGTVRSRFRVTALGDIEVQGSIEDALVQADGNVSVHGGILGGEWGKIRAEKNVVAGYSQNAHIFAGADVELRNSDTGSDIEARGRIVAKDRRGCLRGGRYKAFAGIVACELGSERGLPTQVTVGSDPSLDRELDSVRKRLCKAQEAERKAVRNLGFVSAKATRRLSSNRAMNLRRSIKARREGRVAVERLLGRKRRLKSLQEAAGGCTINVRGTVHPGVEIRISGARFEVMRPLQNVRFAYDKELDQIQIDSFKHTTS